MYHWFIGTSSKIYDVVTLFTFAKITGGYHKTAPLAIARPGNMIGCVHFVMSRHATFVITAFAVECSAAIFCLPTR